MQVRAGGTPFRVYGMHRGLDGPLDYPGYWTSREAGRLRSGLRTLAWIVLGRPPRTYFHVEPAAVAPGTNGGGTATGEGVREPRRPRPPTRSGHVELTLPEAR